MTKTISATKKMLAMLLAVLIMFSGMAVMASADVAKPDKPTFELNETDKKVTITPPAGAEISISPLPSDPIKVEGKVIYINLVPGTKYTVKSYVTDATDPQDPKLVYSDAVTFTVKVKQPAPSAPVPTKVTSTTITVAQVNGCSYKLVELDKATGEEKTVKQDWTNKIFVYEKLTPDTPYLLSIRKDGTEDKYPSDPVNVTVKTLKAADKNAAAKPVLVDKTDKTIVVAEVENVQFSIDKGATWQTSGTFTNLKANTIYGVIARKNFDKAVQDPNPSSAVLEVKTNTRARYTAAPGKCTFKVADGTIYADKAIAVTVTSDGPAGSFKNIKIGEYGDTKLIPIQVTIGEDNFPLTHSKDNVYTGTITPDASLANKKNVEVTVTYKVEKFNGATYVATEQKLESKHTIDIGAKWGILTILGEAFSKLGNLFLNTIPQFIVDIFGSESASKLFGGIMDLIGKLGKQ